MTSKRGRGGGSRCAWRWRTEAGAPNAADAGPWGRALDQERTGGAESPEALEVPCVHYYDRGIGRWLVPGWQGGHPDDVRATVQHWTDLPAHIVAAISGDVAIIDSANEIDPPPGWEDRAVERALAARSRAALLLVGFVVSHDLGVEIRQHWVSTERVVGPSYQHAKHHKHASGPAILFSG